ncbi:MAG: hypothetical protein AB7O32_14415 [Vicinamibacterales bacterium]
MRPKTREGGIGAATRPSPNPPAPAPLPPRRERFLTYGPILTVRLRHDFYGAGGERWCEVTPAAESLAALADHGLLLRRDGDEVIVLAESSRMKPWASLDGGRWLALRLDAIDPHFTAVSEGDLGTGRPVACRYFSGPEAGDAPSGAAPAALLTARVLPCLPASVDVDRMPGDPLDIVDRAGRVVRHLPAAPEIAADAPAGGKATRRIQQTAPARVRVDVADLPPGYYAFRVAGRTVVEGLVLQGPRVPAAFLDLHLPADGLPVQVDVAFKARRIHWRYSVVPRTGSGALDGLSIAPALNGAALRGEATPAFIGPFDVTLPNGAAAQQFVSAEPIALARRSRIRLRLNGRRKERMTRDSVLVDALPVPAHDHLARLTDEERERLGTTEPFCSEMFVYV